MDDSKFDKTIRDKIGEFDDVAFDPAALASFHHQMDANYVAPWYVKYRSEMFITAASVTIAILLLWGQNRIAERNMILLRNELASNQLKNDELMNELSGFNRLTPDTIRVIEYRDNADQFSDLSRELSYLRGQLAQIQSVARQTQAEKTQLAVSKKLIFLGKESELPTGLVRELEERGGLVKNGSYLFMTMDEDELIAYNDPHFRKRKGLTDNYILPEYEFFIDTVNWEQDNITTVVDKQTMQYSVKKINELEKHYQKGIGIEIGPAVEWYRADFNVGEPSMGFGGGIVANFITSPRLGFETGLLFHMYNYEGDEGQLSNISLPDADPELGDFVGAEVNSWFLETPINLKYRTRLNQKNHLLFGLGVSAMIFTEQEFELKYQLEVGADRSVPVEALTQNKSLRFDFGTANFSAGLKSRLKNGKAMETSLIYKKSLSGLGQEGAEADFFGLRASYLFTAR